MRRSALSILLVSCLMAPFLGMYAFLKIQQRQIRKEIKHEMMAGIDRSLLVKIEIATDAQNQPEWEHSGEFKYKGEMYDVVESSTTETSTIYWVWWDQEETTLMKQLNQLVAEALGTNPIRKQTNSQFISLLKLPVLLETQEYNYQSAWLYLPCTSFKYLQFGYSVNQSPPTPPPQHC